MIKSITESLNGGYAGLYGEVVDSDIYHLRDVDDIVSVNDPSFVHEKGHKRGFNFVPEVVYDFGANVGIFSRYARSLFPDAVVISVEPDPENCKVFRAFTNDPKITLIESAIGAGGIWRANGAVNGAHECYLSEGLGYIDINNNKSLTKTSVPSIMPCDIIDPKFTRSILKLDIEGAENVIWGHKPSFDAIKKIDYICGELHYFAQDAQSHPEVLRATERAFAELAVTHNVTIDNVNFWAVKK